MHEQKTMESRTKIIPIAIVVLLVSLLAPQLQSANAGSKSPYESGRDHGCDDADISDPDDRYINQPEKGPSFHTNEFMRGYNAGYDSCSGSGGGGSSGGSSSGGDTAADGSRNGKAQGHSDAINGRPSDASCGSGHSNSYCAAYKVAYNLEYHWTNLVQD
ncbi:MAG: hypothetical protein ACRD5J_02690 [Nitrososphaeraceae archaeon]